MAGHRSRSVMRARDSVEQAASYCPPITSNFGWRRGQITRAIGLTGLRWKSATLETKDSQNRLLFLQGRTSAQYPDHIPVTRSPFWVMDNANPRRPIRYNPTV